jgi:hypothetical protein
MTYERQLKPPSRSKFSFYRYLDLKHSAPATEPSTELIRLPANTPVAGQESAQSPEKSLTGTPKFVSSEDNTQAKTNYYTEPSIGTILINFTNKLNNRYVIAST